MDDVSSGTDEITCDVINTVTRTDIPTVEPNTNDVRARSNVDEGSITVGNDSSNVMKCQNEMHKQRVAASFLGSNKKSFWKDR